MVYINSRGQIEDKRSLSWSTPLQLLLAFFNFLIFFCQTLLPFGSRFGESSQSSGRRDGRGGGGGGGSGWGGGGGGGGGRTPGQSNVRTLGRCGGPNAPPAAGG